MRCIFIAVIIFSGLQVYAQKDSAQTVFSLQLHRGKTVVHTQAVKNIAGAKPYGIQLEWAKQQTNFAAYNISSAYVKTGWALSYFNYDIPVAGYGIIANRFIEPQYRLTKKIHFAIRASAGISYLSNPNDEIKNPLNNNYSLFVNPYMHLGTGLNVQVSQQVTAGIQANFHHISNGNIKQPNKGINWVTTAVSMHYYPGNNNLPKYKRVQNKFWKADKAIVKAGVFYVPHQGYFVKWNAQRKYLVGAFSQITKQIGGASALTAGAEVYYNDFVQDAGVKKITSGVVAGVHGGHVFLLGKMQFSQQVGYALYNRIYFLPNFYHRWGLEYAITNRLSIGGNLKANSDNADFFDFRLAVKL